jgi:hypothetical protein
MKETNMTLNQPAVDDDEVIACLLSEREKAMRADEVGRELSGNVEEVEELADGYAYRFPAGEPWAEKLTAFVSFERRCCPFATYELSFTPHLGPVWLRVRGSAAVKRFVLEEFHRAFGLTAGART